MKRGHLTRNLKEEEIPAMHRAGRVLGKGPGTRHRGKAWRAGPALSPSGRQSPALLSPPGIAQHPSAETPVPLWECISSSYFVYRSASPAIMESLFVSPFPATCAGTLPYLIHSL